MVRGQAGGLAIGRGEPPEEARRRQQQEYKYALEDQQRDKARNDERDAVANRAGGEYIQTYTYLCIFICMYICIYVYIYIGLARASRTAPSLTQTTPCCIYVYCTGHTRRGGLPTRLPPPFRAAGFQELPLVQL